jgi:hypothetical protein
MEPSTRETVVGRVTAQEPVAPEQLAIKLLRDLKMITLSDATRSVGRNTSNRYSGSANKYATKLSRSLGENL